MHLAGSGRVIIQLSDELSEGVILCDEKGTKVAKVMELIGPVKRPFASAMPLTNNIKKYIGKSVFAVELSPAKKEKYRRRKK
jgi:RNA-binding protein